MFEKMMKKISLFFSKLCKKPNSVVIVGDGNTVVQTVNGKETTTKS